MSVIFSALNVMQKARQKQWVQKFRFFRADHLYETRSFCVCIVYYVFLYIYQCTGE